MNNVESRGEVFDLVVIVDHKRLDEGDHVRAQLRQASLQDGAARGQPKRAHTFITSTRTASRRYDSNVRVDMVAFDGMDELDAVGPLEVLRRAHLDVQLVSISPRVTCAYGLTIITDGEPRDDADVVVFPGGGWVSRAAKGVRAEVDAGSWRSLIEATSKRGAILASVCTGAMILAAAGALRGRRATTHHDALADLEAAGAILVRQRVVDDGDIITAGGVTSGIDLALHLVDRFVGADAANGIAESLEYRPATSAC